MAGRPDYGRLPWPNGLGSVPDGKRIGGRGEACQMFRRDRSNSVEAIEKRFGSPQMIQGSPLANRNFNPSRGYLVKESEPRLLAEAVVLGVVGGLAAQCFTYALRICEHFFLILIAGYRPPGLPEEGGVLKQVIGHHGLWLIPVATTLGGLISGLLVYTFAPEAEGHGTDTVVKSFHRTGGFIRARVAPLKLIASAITIGSGGSAGREGPTALIGAAVGSIYATTLGHRRDEERSLLVLMGMAAGLSAIFRSPIGAAFFAVEVLYGNMEFESGALLYTMLASVVAYGINGLFVGWRPLFYFPTVPIKLQLLGYVSFGALGCASGLIATLLPVVFYRLRDAFRALPFPASLNPAIGGLGVGLLAIKFPQILGGGYGWIQEAIYGRIALDLLLVLIFLKIIAFALTVSSGGSGGVFAPTLFVGAMLGGVISSTFHLPAAPFVVVGMVAVFGAAARVPIAALVMVTEMTGGYQLLPAAAFAVLLSYLIQTRLSAGLKYVSLYEAQVLGRAQSPVRLSGKCRPGAEATRQRQDFTNCSGRSYRFSHAARFGNSRAAARPKTPQHRRAAFTKRLGRSVNSVHL